MSSEVDPLLKEVMSPTDDEDDWMGENQTEETKSSWFLFLLTFGGLGLQIGWSVETSNGSVSDAILSFLLFGCLVRALHVQTLNMRKVDISRVRDCARAWHHPAHVKHSTNKLCSHTSCRSG